MQHLLSNFFRFKRSTSSLLRFSCLPQLSQPSSQISLFQDSSKKNYNNNNENKSSFNFARILMGGAIVPLILLQQQRNKNEDVQCLWSSKPSLDRNRIKGRIAFSEYNANDPIEDRYHCKQLKTIDAFVCAVFDGHGGWALSEYAKNLFINELDFQLEQLAKKKFESEDAYITEAMNRSFDYIEQSFFEVAKAGKIEKPFNTGSCALVALFKDNKVYTANIGDCKGVIISEGNDKKFKARKINHKLNANSKKEQARLKKDFPNDPDIVICKRGGQGACYVKGRLMPTRAFGDFHLKHADLFKGKGKFAGPYITHKPEIIINQLEKGDKYIIMASDGLWDEMKKNTIAEVTEQNKSDKSKVVTELLNTALVHAAKDAKLTLTELADIPPGNRRRYHDDITIVCVDLENQFK